MKQEYFNGIITSIRLEKSEKQELEKISKRERKSIQRIIRQLVQEYLKNHSAGNSAFQLEKWCINPDFKAVPTYLSTMQTWVDYYKDSNEKDRTSLRIQAMNLQKWFRNIDFNEERR